MSCPDVPVHSNQNLLSNQPSFHFGDEIAIHCDLGFVLAVAGTHPYMSECVIAGAGVDWSNSVSAPVCTGEWLEQYRLAYYEKILHMFQSHYTVETLNGCISY